MAIKINFDPTHNPELPTLILAKKNGEKFGVLKYRNLVIKDCLSNPTEINFTIDKYLDGEKNNFWDEVLNFRAVYCKEWDVWFELTMDIDEANSTIKNVACVELSQAELSQIMLYDIEINTETDIEREDYVNPTVLYNKDKPNESLLNRIMGKADHYSIEYVSPTITNIQRTFTFDDTSLYDAFNKIAEEINCLFVFNSGTKSDGKIARGISVYDLESNCLNCGHRGEFTQKCPKCNSENIDEGYGDDTTIFVTADEIAKNIKLSTDTGAVKNCFKLRAGDDLMTATIRNCNPNGTDYIWYLSNTVKEDMSEELKAKITEYDATYENYRTKYKYEFHPAQVIGNYNSVINTYEKYNSDLSSVPNPIWGYSDLVKEYYNATDFLIYLQSELMPNASLSDTNANLQLALLTTSNLSPVSVTELNNLSLSTANNVVLSMARAIVDLRYEVKIVSSSLSGYIWTGRFSVVNYSDEEDGATGTTDISIVINDDYENFLKQKLFETLSKNNENMSISGLFDISKSLSEFDGELKKYCLDSLLSFQSICQSCLDILIEQDISASWDSPQDSLYSKVYEPYLLRMKSIEREIDSREAEISTIQTTREYIEKYIALTHTDLDFQNYLGENLWNEFILYRREDKYSNDNYVSDGLNNAEIIQKASEFISVAEKEIFKSAELQHSISASLNDFLVIEKFKSLVDYFNVGNWIRVRIDDMIYKLRLLSYEIDFDNLENIAVEFSDVFKTIDGYADQESVISNAAKMSSSYPATQRQASLGEQSQATLDDWYLNGINTATTKIINEADDQCQIWDRHGMLFKKFDPVKNDYNPNQMKIINSTIALTTDNWTTTKMAIGLFKYVDPTTQEEKEVYGVNGETIIGNLLLGKNLNITNSTGSMMFDENGLTVSNGVNTISINPNNTYLFNIKNQEEDLLSFDETDGSLKIVGNIVAKNLKLTNNLDYNKLLYVDSNGMVTGVNIDTELNTESTNPIQNKPVATKIKALEITDARHSDQITKNALNIANNSGKIETNTSNIAINKTTLGYQKKNLFNLTNPVRSTTMGGITFTVNADKTITLNGTATTTPWFELKESLYIQENNLGGCKYSTGLTENSDSGCYVNISYYDANWSHQANRIVSNNDVVLNGNYTYATHSIVVTEGTTLNNVIVKPMVRLPDITDTTFEPYIESVDERLDNKANISDVYTKSETDSAISEKLSAFEGVKLKPVETKVDRNTQLIANNSGNISALQTDINGLNAQVEYMAEHKANTTSVTANTNAISALDTRVTSVEKEIDGLDSSVEYLSEHKANTTTVTANANAISELDERMTSAESEISTKLDITSKTYIPIRYITGGKDFNTDFLLYSADPDKVIFSNSDKALQNNAPFSSFRYPYILTVEKMKYSNFEEDFDLRQTCIVIEYGGSDSVEFVEYQRIYKGLPALWTQWKKTGEIANIANEKADGLTKRVEDLEESKNIQDEINAGHSSDIQTNTREIGILQGTLGFVAKNKYKNTTSSVTKGGVTFTVNSDGTIAANGTATANFSVELSPIIYIEQNDLVGDIFSFGVIETNKNYRGLIKYYDSSWTEQASEYLDSTETALRNYCYAIPYIYVAEGATLSNVIFKPMLRDGNIRDDTFCSYSGLNVIKRFEKFLNQKILYSKTTSSTSPLAVNVSSLFANYSAVICNIVTSNGKYSLTLPLKYIKSLGTSAYYEAEDLLFYYIDDSNIRISTGLAQSNPTISSIKIIGLY